MGNAKSKRELRGAGGVEHSSSGGASPGVHGRVSSHADSESQSSALASALDSAHKSIDGPARACLDDFVLLKTVGRGSFGKVVQVRKKSDNKIYAMKVLKKEMVMKRDQVEHTISERRILANISHPFIVSLRYAFQTEHKLYMVFDFFNGGELYHYLSEGGRFTEERARFYAAEITSALGYLHDRGIVYRDLKPENLILDASGHIRVTDFGLSKEDVDGDVIKSICGTPEYLAPEILRKKPYGKGVDWWALGTLLFEMIAGLPPFYDRNRQVMYRKILSAEMSPPAFMSPEAVDICRKLLNRDPTQRLGANGAEELKAHPFFAKFDWNELDTMRIEPPWKPGVTNDEDTSRIAAEFTKEPAAVTPSPADTRLRDAAGATPPSFNEFTFTHESVLDGNTYRVSFSDDEFDELVGGRDGQVTSRSETKSGGAEAEGEGAKSPTDANA